MGLELPGIFAAGLLTFASPCVLPLVPLYLGLLAGTTAAEAATGGRTRRALAGAIAFALGLVAVFAALGMAASAVGQALNAWRHVLLPAGGIVVVLFGLKMLGVLRLPALNREARPALARLGRPAGLLGSFAFGAAFALGWSPCVGPVLGSVLTYTASAASSPAMGALYLSVYGAGLALPLVATAAAAGPVLRALARLKSRLMLVERLAGAALVLAGLLLATDKLGWLVPETGAPAVAATEGEPAACDAAGAHACAVPAATGAAEEAAVPSIEGPALVQFSSRSCAVCARMEPVMRELAETCAAQGVRVVRLEADGAQVAALARKLGVRGLPTFLFLDDLGGEASRLVGEQTRERLVEGLQGVSGVRCAQRAEPAGDAARPSAG